MRDLPVSPSAANRLLVQPFPAPGKLMALAYRKLILPRSAPSGQIRAVGNAQLLPRPWEPATCCSPQQRQQFLCWLDALVDWLVTEYVWDVGDMIPVCWPQHPHLCTRLRSG
jgi:hypothetical protein